jgi:hypothetical protein
MKDDPTKKKLPWDLLPYFAQRGFTVGSGLLFFHSCIVVPASMQREVLSKIHEGHQGIGGYRERAKRAVWWPGMFCQMKSWVKRCKICAKHSAPVMEPLKSDELSSYPWQKVASDLFYLKGKMYLTQ